VRESSREQSKRAEARTAAKERKAQEQTRRQNELSKMAAALKQDVRQKLLAVAQASGLVEPEMGADGAAEGEDGAEGGKTKRKYKDKKKKKRGKDKAGADEEGGGGAADSTEAEALFALLGEELNNDFDPDALDAKMRQIFDDKYYAADDPLLKESEGAAQAAAGKPGDEDVADDATRKAIVGRCQRTCFSFGLWFCVLARVSVQSSLLLRVRW
jgi:hypothetical protein